MIIYKGVNDMNFPIKIIRLRFKAGLHIGADNSGIGKENVQNIIHCDTIFSMLVNAKAALASGDQQEINAFIQSIKSLSSGFLFRQLRGEHNYEYFLPRPLNTPPDFLGPYKIKRRIKYGKAVKNASFITLDLFQKWVTGKQLGVSALEKIGGREYRDLYAIRVRPRRASDRLTDASHYYHAGEMYLKNNAGIYFLISSEIGDQQLEAVLKHAGDNGLGGIRNSGKGVFDFEISPLDQQWTDIMKPEGENHVIMSLFAPGTEEIDNLDPVAYSLILRKGWTFSSIASGQFKRKTCRMFGEGSVFRNKPEGCLVDVTPDPQGAFLHRFFRFGKALSIPCAVQEESYE
jgi:CRISPR-associated protein Csm4